MNASSSLASVTSSGSDLGVGLLAVFSLMLGIAVGVFLVKYGWRKLKSGADGDSWRSSAGGKYAQGFGDERDYLNESNRYN